MGLEISEIKNKKLRNLAKDIDKNNVKDGKLDEKEFEIFKTKSDEKYGSKVSKKDFEQAMGLYRAEESTVAETQVKAEAVEEAAASAEVAQGTPTPATVEPIQMQGESGYVLKEKEIVFVGELIEKYNLNKPEGRTPENYRAFAKELANAAYNSHDISPEAYNAIMFQLNGETEKTIDSVIGLKDSFKAMEYRAAREVALDRMPENEKQSVSRKDLEKATKEVIKESHDGKFSGDYKKVQKNEGVKIENEVLSREKTVDFHKIQTEAQIKDVLKDKYDINLDLLIERGLVEKVDGGYDLTKLSDIIRDGVGADYELSRTHSKIKATSELEQTATKLSQALGLNGKISDKEIKRLLKLCGYKVEGKDWKKVVLNTLKGGAVGAAISAGTAFMISLNKLDNSVYVHNLVDLNIISSGSVSLAGSNIEGIAQLIETENGVRIICDQDISVKNIRQLSEAYPYMIPQSMITGVVAGALAGLLDGIKAEKVEEPVVTSTLSTDIKTYDDYVSWLDNLRDEKKNPEKKYAPVLKLLAQLFIDENGNWDKAGYQALLNHTAGTGGVVNRKELVKLIADLQAGKVKVETENVIEQPKTEKEHTYDTYDKKTPGTPDIVEDVLIIDNKTASQTGWSYIANETYPDLVKTYGLAKAIRIIKLAQACEDPSLYSKENMEMLMNLSYMNPNELKKVKGFNYDVYTSKLGSRALVKANDPDDVLYAPKELAGAKRMKDPSAAPKQPKQEGSGNGTAPKRSVAGQYVTPGTPGSEEYGAKFDDGDWNSYGSDKAKRDGAVDDFKTQYPNAKRKEQDEE